ncbi:MAG: carboxylating nicotinate-nucleotide diphosphorylase [Promethearchaeota archaeon]
MSGNSKRMNPYELLIRNKLEGFLKEDSQFKDVTSEVIPRDANGDAILLAKQEGIVGGILETRILFEMIDCKVVILKDDGESVKPGNIIAKIRGNLRNILFCERTALNLLMHLSGVATATKKFQDAIDAVKKNPRCRIAATRKTTPGLRAMEKRIVETCGGDTHRWNLDDMILLKDTHRAYFKDVKNMIDAARSHSSFSKKIEVEVESVDDALEAARAGADIIMLDNMEFSTMTSAIKALEDEGFRDKMIIESSGNVSLGTVAGHAKTGVDLISTSAITIKAEPIDISLELI